MQPLFYRRICGRLQKAVIRFPRNKSEGGGSYRLSEVVHLGWLEIASASVSDGHRTATVEALLGHKS